MKPFTTIAAIFLLGVAAAHVYRLYSGAIAVSVSNHVVPLWVSWPAAIVCGLLGIMLFVEARR